MTTILRRVLLSVCLCGLTSVHAAAQQSIQDVLSFLITNQAVQTEDFARDRAAAEATRDTLTRAFLLALANLPVASGSGGFTYRLNPGIGTVERASDSFGPFFVERALTSGRGQASIGLTYQHANFTRLDGHRLADGSLITTANRFRSDAAPFDVDRLTMRIQTDTVTAAGSIGLSDRVDVSASVPFISLRLSGDRINGYRGETFPQAHAAAATTGIGDTSVRAKYHIVASGAAGLAAWTEVRLPTGNEQNLLGAGRMGWRAAAVVSHEGRAAAEHVNVGVTRGALSPELNYSGAVGFAASPRATVVFELLGRRVDALGALANVSQAHPVFPGVDTVRLLPDGRAQSIVNLAAGLKWNAGGLWLVKASVLVPLTKAGLTAPFVPAVSVDRAFGR